MEKKQLLLDDFTHGDLSRYEKNTTFVRTYQLAISDTHVKGGKSLQLSYHFGGWTAGNGAMYIIFKDNLITKSRPLKLGMWVHGDGKSPWLRAVIVDGEGQRKTINLTDGNIDWFGWKYVDAPLDATWPLPFTLEKIYAVEIDKSLVGNADYKGDIYFQQIRFVYIDDEDLTGPTFHHVYPKENVMYRRAFVLSVQVSDDKSGVDPTTIRMLVNGKLVKHAYDANERIVSYHFRDLDEGLLHIMITAKDKAGNISLPGVDKKLWIDLSPDTKSPVISQMTPTQYEICYTTTPRITFHAIDEQSGIDENDITITLNGERLHVTYDEKTGWGYSLPEKKLRDGEHVLRITAQDRAGNTCSPIERRFFIREIQAPINTENFRIAVIPDTHAVAYAAFVFQHIANEDVSFVMHMGDMVDAGINEEYEQFIKATSLLQNKRLLAVAGNHEAFQGNLDLFMSHFGSPTYHLEYGNTLFIVLHSAYDQSMSQSDATQLHYVATLLARTNKKSIVIATHVPVKDTFGTAHEMEQEDAGKFKNLLRDFKQKNQDVSITVLFGHLHVLNMWEQDGVHYVITGNAAPKGYVTKERGNIHGYGILHITPSGITYEFKPFVMGLEIFTKHAAAMNYFKIKQGEKLRLHVRGYFQMLDVQYDVDLIDFPAITMKWKSSHEHIASVDMCGVLYAKEKGTTQVTVSIVGKTTTATIEVM
ncbi:metallophosphoesterase [Virgibacillus soli]|uniref:metallophosphoesterase n=1 Tax=Paracerasibacillus soli TaxID=480284 RepID=UPI0035EFEC38